jgi:hypothetical protein
MKKFTGCRVCIIIESELERADIHQDLSTKKFPLGRNFLCQSPAFGIDFLGEVSGKILKSAGMY